MSRQKAPTTKEQKIEAVLALLGKESDRIVAERFGMKTRQIATLRKKMGIHPKRGSINWDQIPLGTAPDSHFSQLLKIDNRAVAAARWVRGIPAWCEWRRCVCSRDYRAKHMRQRFCSNRCQRYHWQLVNQKGIHPIAADCAIAVWSLKQTIQKKGGLANVEE